MPLGRYQAKLALPFATVGVRTRAGAMAQIAFLPRAEPELSPADPVAEEACRQLLRYRDDPAFRFDLPLCETGTSFQRRVWAGIAAIPAGATQTYRELAARLGSAPRAVGQACGANPLPLIIPCHRVVSVTGIGGFAQRTGGFPLSIKRWLLEHERRLA